MCTERERGSQQTAATITSLQTHYGRGFMKSVSGLEKQANKLLQGSQESSALSLSILKRWAPKHRVKTRCVLGALSVCVSRCVASDANIH